MFKKNACDTIMKIRYDDTAKQNAKLEEEILIKLKG